VEDILGLVLGGGRGAGLYPSRSTAANRRCRSPQVSPHRHSLSNCINSGVRRVHVLTQYLSVSLHRHIAATYKFDPFTEGSVEVLARMRPTRRPTGIAAPQTPCGRTSPRCARRAAAMS
jgi:glucose-1-phosphate adenylyltransferase